MFFLGITLLVMSVSSASAQAVWGGRIGFSHYMEKATFSGAPAESGNAQGIELGPVLYYSLKDNFYFNTGAMLGIMLNTDDKFYYVDIPLYLGLQIPTGNSNLSFFGQAGPYIGFWFPPSDRNVFFNNFQAGLGIMAGMNIKRFKFELGYKAGLTNLLSVEEGQIIDGSQYMESKSKMSSLFLGVSYVF